MKCWCGGDVGLAGPMNVCLDSQFHDPYSTGKPDKVKRLYVAGPMTGITENNYPEFNRISSTLRDAGYEVVNPAEFGVHGGRVHYVDLLREDLRVMLDCHGIAVHGDWWESSGARNEVNVGGLLKMAVRPWTEWLERAFKELS
jgi:hypothetical protein